MRDRCNHRLVSFTSQFSNITELHEPWQQMSLLAGPGNLIVHGAKAPAHTVRRVPSSVRKQLQPGEGGKRMRPELSNPSRPHILVNWQEVGPTSVDGE